MLQAHAAVVRARSEELTTTPLRMAGTLEGYDAKTGAITVCTLAGPVRLSLALNARIHVGHQAADRPDLVGRIGSHVVLRFVEPSGHREAISVHVLDDRRGPATTLPK